MYIAVIAFLLIVNALLLYLLGYCVCKINKENSKTALDYSASDIGTAHTTGWFGENM